MISVITKRSQGSLRKQLIQELGLGPGQGQCLKVIKMNLKLPSFPPKTKKQTKNTREFILTTSGTFWTSI